MNSRYGSSNPKQQRAPQKREDLVLGYHNNNNSTTDHHTESSTTNNVGDVIMAEKKANDKNKNKNKNNINVQRQSSPLTAGGGVGIGGCEAGGVSALTGRPSLLTGLNLSNLALNLDGPTGVDGIVGISSGVGGISSSRGGGGGGQGGGGSRVTSNMSTGTDETSMGGGGLNRLAPPRPRRLWKVVDTKLRIYPPLWALPSRNTSCFIHDAAPSVIAVRIAECLRKRSMSVEYDEEAATATVMTVDRCHFTVQLWHIHPKQHQQQQQQQQQNEQQQQQPENKSSSSSSGGQQDVLVECLRNSGSVITFHRSARAILAAAKSYDSGEDRRDVYQSSPFEYPRWTSISFISSSSSSSTTKPKNHNERMKKLVLQPKKSTILSTPALMSLEQAVALLRKDRLDAQRIGMEMLVQLTCVACVGLNSALYASLAILGAPISSGSQHEQITGLNEIHRDWILTLLVERKVPREAVDGKSSPGNQQHQQSFSFSCKSSARALNADNNILDDPLESKKESEQQEQTVLAYHSYHGGAMRSLALRAIANALWLLGEKQPRILKSVLSVQAPQWISARVINVFIDDLQGANRPPGVIHGTALASQHEAVYCIRCLGVIAAMDENVKKKLLKEGTLVEYLEKARQVGRSTHRVLAEESERVYQQLTEDVRSC